jgi:hypothetical protein
MANMTTTTSRVGVVEGVMIAALLGGLTACAVARLHFGERELQGTASVGAVLGVLAYGTVLALLLWSAAKKRARSRRRGLGREDAADVHVLSAR